MIRKLKVKSTFGAKIVPNAYVVIVKVLLVKSMPVKTGCMFNVLEPLVTNAGCVNVIVTILVALMSIPA